MQLADIDVIKNFGLGESGTTIKDGRESEEIILRFFALNNDLEEYDNKLSKFLDTFMKDNYLLDEDSITELENKFSSTLEKCQNVFNASVFTNPQRQQPRQSLALYDLLMWSFSHETPAFLESKRTEIYEAFCELCDSEIFTRTMTGGLQQKSSILTRRRLWTEKLTEIKANE